MWVWRGVGVTPVDVGVGSKAGCGEVWVWRGVGVERCGCDTCGCGCR